MCLITYLRLCSRQLFRMNPRTLRPLFLFVKYDTLGLKILFLLQVCSIAWSTHYKELISGHGYANNQLVIWKYPVMTRVAELNGHMARVLHLALSPDGTTVLSAGADETLRQVYFLLQDLCSMYEVASCLIGQSCECIFFLLLRPLAMTRNLGEPCPCSYFIVEVDISLGRHWGTEQVQDNLLRPLAMARNLGVP